MLRELINYVESIEFDVSCGLASGTTMFKRILDEDSHVQKLVELCQDRAVAVFILGHMLDLALRKFDNRYRNPLEVAMATYLHCICTSRKDLMKSAMSAAHLMKGAYWPGRYISQYLVTQ